MTAHRLAHRPEVQAIVIEERERLARSQQVSNDRILSGLAVIAEDRSNPASARVSAYRTLADIRGLLGGQQQELPPALSEMLRALGRGITASR